MQDDTVLAWLVALPEASAANCGRLLPGMVAL